MVSAMNHPMQQLVVDANGHVRFRANVLVRYLVDTHPGGMNALAALPGISNEDRSQLAQLIGYSLTGYGELSYVSHECYETACKAAEELKP